MHKRDGGTTFNCFSPPVMIATVIIELSLALYTFWRYKLNSVSRLVLTMLVALATFQVAEYFVCTGAEGHAVPWSRLGFVAITALPPLGLHLMHVLSGKQQRRLVNTAYVVMAIFMGYFLAAPTAFTGHQCTGNYVIFQFSEKVTGTYFFYYFGWLLAGIGLGMKWLGDLKAKKLKAVQGLIVGYLVFLVPSGLAMVIKPETRRGIPSVMCGFAVLLALILALYIMPRIGQLKSLTKAAD